MTENVVDLGEYRITRKRDGEFARKVAGQCRHLQWTMDEYGQVVTCDGCAKQLSPYWALGQLIGEYTKWTERYNIRAEKLAADRTANLHLTAARRAEQAWRSRTMVPCCPHCGEGISAADGFGASMINKRIDDARRADRARAKAAAVTPPAGATP